MYLRSLPDEAARKEFAARCGTSIGYLALIRSGARKCGESLAITIDRESGGAVPCEVLRPDVDWAYLRSKALA